MKEEAEQSGVSSAYHLKTSQPGAIAAAAELIRQGELVVFPTDTVYGIGVNPFDEPAIGALFEAKRRPRRKGIPVLLSSLDCLGEVALRVPDAVLPLIERFWPGPLTLILPRPPELPAILSPNTGVAVRIPDHSVARDLIEQAGGALATSSANLSGHPPARSGLEALEALGSLVAAVLDDGPTPGGVASTVVDFRSGVPVVIRPGPISPESLSLSGLLL